MTEPRILITVTGMGDPEEGDTFSWAARLFPDGELYRAKGRDWLQFPDGGQIYLLEVRYEDVNDALLTKNENVKSALSAGPDKIDKALQEYPGDVITQVLVDKAIDAAQMRFMGKYMEALHLARALVGPAGNIGIARIGVLCHSLGTLIAFEGLARCYDKSEILQVVPVNLVMCAPMLAPMCTVQRKLRMRRYLVAMGACRPSRHNPASKKTDSIIRHCLAIYDRKDPFHRIHSDAFYGPATNPKNKLVDKFHYFDSDADNLWEGHFMEESYLRHNRQLIAEFLFQ